MRVISGKLRGTKLNSIESNLTRPTLDRVKESLFNIMQNQIEDSIILDLFAGSGAIAIEFLSRGAKKAYLCDKSQDAVKMIKQNLQKTRLTENSIVINKDYKKCLDELQKSKVKFDIIFLDPPYEADLSIDAVKTIKKLDLIKEQGSIEVKKQKKYGRVSLIFI